MGLGLWGLLVWQTVYAVDDTPVFKAQKFTNPTREHSIIVTEEGFYPESISVFKGEKVRFFVTATTERKECFLIKGKEIFLSAEKGKVSEGIVMFNDPGTYQYYCPTNNYKGTISVIVKKDPNKPRRRVASETVRIWMPKEE